MRGLLLDSAVAVPSSLRTRGFARPTSFRFSTQRRSLPVVAVTPQCLRHFGGGPPPRDETSPPRRPPVQNARES
jgi:hypothetical protein